MDLTTWDVSINKLLVDTSHVFFEIEKDLPKENFLPNFITTPYLNTLNLLLLISASENQFSKECYEQFSVFLSFITKSTLYFNYCFDHPISEPNSKLALMFGDLYLVKGGAYIVEIKNYLRMHASFRELLYSIAMAQRVQQKSKNLIPDDFEKIISMSYGNIFRFALLAPYVYTKNANIDKRKKTYLARYVSLFLANHVQPFLAKEKTDQDKNILLWDKIKENLGEELFNGYNFDGWKSDIQKTSGGNDPKNKSIKG